MLKRTTYFFLLLTSFLLLLIGFFQSNEVFDINVHDTYFIIAQNHLYWLFSLLLFFFFSIYFILEKIKVQKIRMLELIHVYATLVSIIGIFFPYQLLFQSSDFPLQDDYTTVNLFRSLSTLFFLIIQILLIINIFVAIIKKLRT